MTQFFGGSSGNLMADRRFDFAAQLSARGDHAEAADLYTQAIELAPAWPPLHFHLGESLRLSGQEEQAVQAYESYLALDPSDAMGALLKLVLLGRAVSPPSLPDAYLQSLFDQYAPRFDTALVENLEYKTPQQILSVLPENRIFIRALDLGCGTGLMGAAIHERTDFLEGVDLSPEMVSIAHDKNFYDRLHVERLEGFLDHAAEPYDLILSADVFVYIGALDAIFARTSALLTPGGLFGFSVQKGEQAPYLLGADHRYAHHPDYIAQSLQQAGFSVMTIENAVLRKDGVRNIHGLIVLAQKI